MADSTWERDRTVLEVVAEADNAGRVDRVGNFTAADVMKTTGLSQRDVEHALTRLDRGGYLEAGHGTHAPDGEGFEVNAITERGLRETGVWPKVEADYEQLVALIENMAEDADTPEEATRWRTLGRGVAGAGRDIAVRFLAELAAHGAGM